MFVKVSEIIVEDRQRQDLGDIDGLANSIKEYGIIQPIVLEHRLYPGAVIPVNDVAEANRHEEILPYRLIVGRRRLAAISKLNWAQLEHGKHFIWLAEANRDELRRKAVELEENLRRKALEWQEEVDAKKKLLDLMQSIHGVAAVGAPTRAEKSGAADSGFGVNKLAAMLGESPAQTSKDLHLANLIKIVPGLKVEQTKSAALRRAQVMVNIATMAGLGKPAGAISTPPGSEPPKMWTLHEGDFRANCVLVKDESVDLVYTDLPFGIDLSELHRHSTTGGGLVGYADPLEAIIKLLPDIMVQSYRVLKPDRFVVFWFGWRYYGKLIEALAVAGFKVDPVPFVWYKHVNASENPNFRYGIVYSVAIVARKGSPIFMRSGQPNLIDLPNVASAERVHIAQQPVELPEKFIKDMVSPGATVLDWTAGAGTTGVAAVKNKCYAIMFEQEPLLCTAIQARLQSLSTKPLP